MIKIENTQFIFVHGLASKPSKDQLHRLWAKALIGNLKIDRPDIGDYLEKNPNSMTSAYWADCIPDHIQDSSAYVRILSKQVDQAIALRKTNKNGLHVSKGGLAAHKGLVKKFGVSIVNTLSRALTVKDAVVKSFFGELNLYHTDQYIADQIRAPLEAQLRKAWEDGKEVVILSHSMGTFISYDVLWRFSHRSEPRYKSFRSKSVKQLITMGSPLGDETLRSFMLSNRWKNSHKESLAAARKRFFPLNIEAWYNYSAMGDVVCHDSTLEDDFFKVMREAVSQFKNVPMRDYVQLFNPYINPDGKPNAHKSYGYLVQPKLSQKLLELIE